LPASGFFFGGRGAAVAKTGDFGFIATSITFVNVEVPLRIDTPVPFGRSSRP
jgi:hypothetical protein